MEESLYDEFGNYLGPELLESEEEEEETLQPMQEDVEEEYEEGEVEAGSSSMALMEIDGTRPTLLTWFFRVIEKFSGFLI
jgi:116 kDa U5 small nuclear ribonucleoprotein component